MVTITSLIILCISLKPSRIDTNGSTTNPPDQRDYVGIATHSTFHGRTFMRSGVVGTSSEAYDDNYVLMIFLLSLLVLVKHSHFLHLNKVLLGSQQTMQLSLLMEYSKVLKEHRQKLKIMISQKVQVLPA